MFDIAKKKIKYFLQLNVSNYINEIISNDEILKAQIIDLNTESQLFEKGIDSLGRTLESIGGNYSPYTVNIKLSKGQPTDRITLNDTGAFYESFEVKTPIGLSYIEITANPYKDGKNIIEEWGGAILGLATESKIFLANELKIRMVEKIKYDLLAA